MVIYVIHYILGFVISALAVFSKKGKIYIFPLVFLLLFLFAAARGNIDRDYGTYVHIFTKFLSHENYFKESNIAFYEPSFYFVPLLCTLISSSFALQLSFVVFAFLGVYLKLRSFDLSNSFFLSVVLYLTNFYLLHEMTQIRIGVGSAILLLSVRHIYDRNPGKFLLFVLTASFFHYSCLVYLPLYYLNSGKTNKRLYFSLLLIFSALSIARVNVFDFFLLASIFPKVELYMKMVEKGIYDKINIWNNAGFLINYVITFILLAKVDVLERVNKYVHLMIKINIISILAYLIFSSIPVIAIRISHVYGVVQLALFPCLIYVFDRRIIGYVCLILVSLIYYYNYHIRIPLFKEYTTWWSTL